MSTLAVAGPPPIVVKPVGKHTASFIFFHGLGDQGGGWAQAIRSDFQPTLKYMKFVCPNAANRAVTLNFGMHMPAWFDLRGLTVDSPEDEAGIEAAKQYAHDLINQEIAAGIPSNRILIGGFSMGAALAIYAGLTYDRPLGGIISMSGFLLQRAKIPGNHTANLQTPIFMGHGQNDFLVPITIGQMTEAALRQFNPNVVLVPYPIDHTSCDAEHRDIRDFIAARVPAG